MPIKHYYPPRKTYAKIAIPFVAISLILAIGAGSAAYAGNSGFYRKDVEHLDQGASISTAKQTSNFDNPSVDASNANDLCDLNVVKCEGEEANAPLSNKITDQKGSANNSKTVAGYDIARYATLPTHEATVQAIYDAMPEIKDKFDAEAYIKSKRPNSPVRGGMVERASIEYGVDMKLMLALMQNDSAFGTAGLGARTHNPGNIANRDDGHTHDYGNWEDGVRGVARWLAKNK